MNIMSYSKWVYITSIFWRDFEKSGDMQYLHVHQPKRSIGVPNRTLGSHFLSFRPSPAKTSGVGSKCRLTAKTCDLMIIYDIYIYMKNDIYTIYFF